jgi:hypothetical protein
LSVHFPSEPALADFDCPANATVTFSPAFAQPHTATGFARCRTRLSEKGDPSRNSAAKTDPPKKQRLKKRVCSEARNVPACSRNLEGVVMKVRFILRVGEQKHDRAMKPMRDVRSCGIGARKYPERSQTSTHNPKQERKWACAGRTAECRCRFPIRSRASITLGALRLIVFVRLVK